MRPNRFATGNISRTPPAKGLAERRLRPMRQRRWDSHRTQAAVAAQATAPVGTKRRGRVGSPIGDHLTYTGDSDGVSIGPGGGGYVGRVRQGRGGRKPWE